jgi:hypothetical protein
MALTGQPAKKSATQHTAIELPNPTLKRDCAKARSPLVLRLGLFKGVCFDMR